MSSILGRLLRRREVTFQQVTEARKEVETHREKCRLELEKVLLRRDRLIEDMKEARRRRDEVKVDILWSELSALRPDVALLRRELRKVNLEYQTLRRYETALSSLSSQGAGQRIRALCERLRRSRLPELLARAELKEERYLEELDSILAEDGTFEEEELLGDPRKEAFLRKLDSINEAEEAGRADEARKRQEALKQELDDGVL